MCDQKKRTPSFKGGYVAYPGKESLPYGWGWPKGVPCDYDAMVQEYGTYVTKTVTRYNKVDRNLKDLLQDVWAKLVGSRLLEKFVEGAARRLPSTMTALEACEFLGVSFPQWCGTLQRKPWLLLPLEGSRFSKTAIFDTREIIDIDHGAARSLWGNRPVPRMRPEITSRGFKTYLSQTIHNHFANWCRTRSRKYKEQLLAPTSVLARQTDGCCRQTSSIEDLAGGWEANIAAAMTIDEESLLDLVDVIKRARIDLGTSAGVEVLDFLIAQGKSCEDGPRRNVEILSLLGQGMTLHEAAKRVQMRARARIRVTATA